MLPRPGQVILAVSISLSGLAAPLPALGSQDLPPPPPPPPGVEPPPSTTPPAPPPSTTPPAPPPTAPPPPQGSAAPSGLPPPPLPPPPPPPPGAATSWETPTAPLADPPPKRRPPRYAPTSEPRTADFSSDPADAAKNPKEKWYGWQILLGLAGSHILLIAGVATEEPVLAFTGTAGHFLSGPITHWANGMVGRGFASVGLNLGLPFGTSLVGAGLDAASGGFVITGFLVGGAIGFVVAPIIDFAALAYKPIEEEGEAQAGVPRFNLTPIVGQGQTGLSFSMQF